MARLENEQNYIHKSIKINNLEYDITYRGHLNHIGDF